MIKKSKILIFGTGFIAENLTSFFLKNDNEIIIIYNNHFLENNALNVKYYSMKEDFDKVLLDEKPDYIICLSGNSYVPDNKNVAKSIETNVLKILSFIEHIYTSNYYTFVKKILVVGSASEYGKLYNSPIDEKTPFHPTSTYGLTKIILQQICQYFIERGLPIVYIRQFNTTGVGQRESFVIPAFINQIVAIEKGAKPLINVGDLSQERDFLDIRDTCFAFNILLLKGSIGQVYNVGSGRFYTISNILDLIFKHSYLSKESVIVKKNKNLFSTENSLSKRLYADITKLRLLGFEPKINIEQTIQDILEYWRNQDV
ncbi:MAG: GDP-mannose 4,6-dehydratase [Arcobacteraceae bacterium]|nr:GDP-mannose 4,6-dehydratase [Arcobacteraceae bacterium]